MATVTVSGVVKDETGRKDSRDWKAFSPVYREGSDGEVVTMRKQQVRVVAGIFTAKLDPGVCVLENPDGQRYTVTIPDEDADLWGIIATAVAFPPNTEAEALASAVNAYLDDNPPAADWNGLINMPAVIAEGATQAAARAAIGAGEQPLVDTAANLAASNPIPAVARRVRETDTGREKTGDGTTHYNDLPYDDDSVEGHVRGHELFQKFTKRADSASIPNIFDSGQKGGTLNSGGVTNSQQYVSSGKLRSSPTNAGTAAGYYTAALSANATRIGARWVFIPHSTNGGTMAIAVTQTQYTTQGSAPAIGIHFVITPLAWAVGYSTTTNGAITNVLTGTFATPLTQDSVTEYWAEAVLVGTTLYIRLPDGTVMSSSWTAGASHCGPGVFFEHFANVGSTDNEIGFIEVWADTGRQRPLVADSFVPWRKVYMAPAGTVSTAAPANTLTTVPGITSGTITAPASGKLLIRQRWYMQIPSTMDIASVFKIDGASFQFAFQYVAKGVSGDREISAEYQFSGLIPGGNYIITPQVSTSVASTIYQNPAGGYNAILTVEPVS